MIKQFLSILFGLLLVVIPVYDWISDSSGLGIGSAALSFLKGGLVWLVIFIGLVVLIVGLFGLKK